MYNSIKKLAKSCEFKDENEMVRDRLVLGIRDKKLQEKLLNIEELNLTKAIETCRLYETMKGQLKNMIEKSETDVDVITKKEDNNSGKAINKRREVKRKEEKKIFKCTKCHTEHGINECPAYGKKCHRCGKFNHYKVACKVKLIKEVIMESEEEQDDQENFLSIDSVKLCNKAVSQITWYENVIINNKSVKFKLDTGCEVNILPIEVLNKINSKYKLVKTDIILEAYGGSKLKPLGRVTLNCKIRDKERTENFIIVDHVKATPLLGLVTSLDFNLISRVNEICSGYTEVQKFLKLNKDLFTGTGKFENKCKLYVKPEAIPVVRPPRRVPLAIQDKLKSTLNNMEKDKIIKKVNSPVEWASNLVIVEKPNKTLRICLDPADLNKVLKREYFLIPTITEIRAKLTGKSWFSVLDLKDGFYHIELDEKSSNLCTFSSPFGYYKFLRLPFGLSVAPEIFQKINTKYFGDIAGVIVYFDDLLISASTEQEHDKILNEVISKARKLNIKFNPNKIQYKVRSVKYLGHNFNKEGMQPDDERVKAVKNLSAPKSKKDVQKIMGLFNYFRNFIPNLSEVSAPLRKLLKKDVEFSWSNQHEICFEKMKSLLCEAPVLANFDDSKEITIHTDASKDGIGCCLLQENKPVFFASRSLTENEKNWAQIEKEYLAMAEAVKKFHYYIYSRKVTLLTDHKPLVSIMKKNIADIVSPRLQRIKLRLTKYELDVKYIPGKNLFVADLLSRNFLKDNVQDDSAMLDVVHSITSVINISNDKKLMFQKEIELDPILNSVKNYCKSNWPKIFKPKNELLYYYYTLRDNLCVIEDILLFKNRIVVPPKLRLEMLQLAHESHFGINKTITRAKSSLYWPKMSEDIQNFINKCKICEKCKPNNIKEPLLNHEIPNRPYSKLASDICQYENKSYLIIFDYFSKWLEIIPIADKTSDQLISKFKNNFATHGIPDIVIADNMPYASYKFSKFADQMGFKIITSSPRYPRSNGQAESGVKIAKNILKKGCDLDIALLNYRNTQITGVGYTPSQLLMSRIVKTKLPVSETVLEEKSSHDYSQVHNKLINKQYLAKQYYDRAAREKPQFDEGQNITMKVGKNWEPAKVIKPCKEPRSYLVKHENGQVYRRNSSQLRQSSNAPDFDKITDYEIPVSRDILRRNENTISEGDTDVVPGHHDTIESSLPSKGTRNSSRIRKLPSRLNDYVL